MKLLLVLLSFCYSCCFHFLFVVSSESHGLLCAPAICAGLDNISFPFGAAPHCGASPSFLLSNCTTSQAYWYAFNEAMIDPDGAVESFRPPAVTGIYSELVHSFINFTWSTTNSSQEDPASSSFINLTWSTTNSSQEVCRPPAHSSEIPHYLPNSINLTDFANSTFQISDYNIYLLFNCSNTSSLSDFKPTVKEYTMSSECQSYHSECSSNSEINTTNCFQLMPSKELMLPDVMASLACSHFQFFVTLNTSLAVKEWRAGEVQLYWNEIQTASYSACMKCENTNGTCGYDDHSNFQCFCPGNQNSSTYCDQRVDNGACNGGLPCMSIGYKIAIGVAVSVVAIAILAVLALCCLRRRRKLSTSRSVPNSSSSNKFWTERALGLSTKLGPVPTKEFSYEELVEATESFADENMIGDGGFGAVYVGFLRDGRKVAIKRLYHDNFRRIEQFYNEMKILSSLRHPNLVKLYGFCCQDDRDLLLVFEYASKGTVSDQLHDVNKPAMPWKVRLNIACETAEALSYLHNSLSPPIFHRDVKTTNILLDDKFHAKLADFGLSRLVPLEVTHVSTAPQGTPGYVDPEYHQCYQLTDKSDVYSFGVVLMELVSGMLAVDMSRNRREINLSSLALMKIACGVWQELVDPRLEMDKNPDVERMVKVVVELVFQCLQAEKDDRPNMSRVAETLADLRRESGYEYEEVFDAQYSKMDVNVQTSVDETRQLIKPKNASNSSNSVQSPVWTSSNTSSNVSSF